MADELDGGNAVADIESMGDEMRSKLQPGTGAPLDIYLPHWLVEMMSHEEKRYLRESNYTIKTHWERDNGE